MNNLLRFLNNEENLLVPLRTQNTNENINNFSSFLNSSLLPRKIVDITLMSNDLNRIISILEYTVLNEFIKNYFESVHVLATSLQPNMSKDEIISLNSLEDLKDISNELSQKEPYFSWLFSEGMNLLVEAQSRLNLDTIEQLSNFIRILDHCNSFLCYNPNEINILVSSLYDIPQWLLDEIKSTSS